MKAVIKLMIGLALPWSFLANALTAEDFLAWFEANQKAEVTFKDGDVITFEDADKIRAFVPPGYQDEMIFDGMEAVVRDPSDISPADMYKEATKLHQSKVTIGEEGIMQNYVAGQPFDPETFVPGDRLSGYKAAWNLDYRWQYGGLKIDNVTWVWVRKGGNHDGHSVTKAKHGENFGGGGTFERSLTGPYQRAYLSHRADLAETDYKIQSSWAKDTVFRELTGFTSPFDIDGTAFIVLRHQNAKKGDDGWAYIPSLRRVRRISAEVKTDSLLGTDLTLEDFYCFSGRVVEHDWKYIGTARSLAVARSRNAQTEYYGPNGWVPKDDWELRTVDVYQQVPKSSSHPYSSKFIMMDRQAGESYYCSAFDQKGDLWKVWQLSKVFSEDPHFVGKDKTPEGVRVSAFQSINVIDKQNDRGTLIPTWDTHYPTVTLKSVKRYLDVNHLTEGR